MNAKAFARVAEQTSYWQIFRLAYFLGKGNYLLLHRNYLHSYVSICALPFSAIRWPTLYSQHPTPPPTYPPIHQLTNQSIATNSVCGGVEV